MQKKIVKVFTIQGGNSTLAMQQYFHEELKFSFLCSDSGLSLAHVWSLKEYAKTLACLGIQITWHQP